MQQAIDQFRISMNRVRDLIALHNSVKAQSTSALDLSERLATILVALGEFTCFVEKLIPQPCQSLR